MGACFSADDECRVKGCYGYRTKSIRAGGDPGNPYGLCGTHHDMLLGRLDMDPRLYRQFGPFVDQWQEETRARYNDYKQRKQAAEIPEESDDSELHEQLETVDETPLQYPGHTLNWWSPPTEVLLTFEEVFNNALGFMCYSAAEMARVPGFDAQVRRLLYGEHSPSGPGYLYVFSLDGDAGVFYKVGYTKDLDRRIREWRRKFEPYGTLRLLLAHRVSRARYAERAVHILLGPRRLGRYLLPDGKIYTEYFYIKRRDPELEQSPLDPAKIPGNVRSYKREVEWFRVTDEEVAKCCADVVSAVDAVL